MGIIINGVYHKDGDKSMLRPRQNTTFKQHDFNRQRKDHAKEILQPYDRFGKPNEAFIEAFPTESKEVYHFLPTDKELENGAR